MSKTVMDAINVFSKKLELGLCDDWTPCERLLMYELIRKWNSCGRPRKFSATNTELAQNIGLSKPTIIRARKRLMARGGIEYIPTGNPRRAGQYSLEPLFKLQPEGTNGRPEKEQLNCDTTAVSQINHSEGEQLNCDTTVVSQINHYQSNSNSGAPKGAAALPEKKKKRPGRRPRPRLWGAARGRLRARTSHGVWLMPRDVYSEFGHETEPAEG